MNETLNSADAGAPKYLRVSSLDRHYSVIRIYATGALSLRES